MARALFVLCWLPFCVLATGALANEGVAAKSREAGQWVLANGDYANSRYSSLDKINRSNVKDLKVAWTFSTGAWRGHEGAPLVVDGVMYIHTPFPNTVYAIGLDDPGRILWRYRPQQDPDVASRMCCDTVSRGLSFAPGLVLLHQADTQLVALDTKTGAVAWSVKTGDVGDGETASGTPFVAGSKVLVGHSTGLRCHVSAYDVASGALSWRAYAVGPDSDILFDPKRTTSLGKPVGENSSLKSWLGNQWQEGGGCSDGWYAFDAETSTVFYGSGSPKLKNPLLRPGDNRWSGSIFARDLETGIAKWVYQLTPFDEWGFGANNEAVLAELEIGGEKRDTVVQFSRGGIAYTLDRNSGIPLVANKYDASVNWTTGVELDPRRGNFGRPYVVEKYSPAENGAGAATRGICPWAPGAKNFAPVAHSQRTGLFYVPVAHVCMDITAQVAAADGSSGNGLEFTAFRAPNSHGGRGNVTAFNAATGRIVWNKPEAFAVWSGMLATAGGVVFYGTLDGYLKAVDEEDGKELFRFKTASGIVGNVASYLHNDKQYVAVLSGIGSSVGIGLAAGLSDPQAGYGAVGVFKDLAEHTTLGGVLTVFSLP